jgi:hypothetical protein
MKCPIIFLPFSAFLFVMGLSGPAFCENCIEILNKGTVDCEMPFSRLLKEDKV